MNNNLISRRRLLAAGVASAAFTILPRFVLGSPRQPAPSDRLNIACIGVGGLGRKVVDSMSGETIYALCDVDEVRAGATFRAYPKAKRYTDFRVMLEKEAENIDAVTVATPHHTHAVAGMMAMRLGKPLQLQKPLARSVWETQRLVEGARAAGVVTQMGIQGHSGEGIRLIREWIEAGAIGKVREIHYWTDRPTWPQAIERPTGAYKAPRTLDWDLWLGPAPFRPYHPGTYVPFNWLGWWDFGTGALGDAGCHLIDAAFWALDLGYPRSITPETTTLFVETAPAASRLVYEFDAKGDRPALQLVWRDGSLAPPRPDGFPRDARWPHEPSGQLWIGDDGVLLAGMYGDNPFLVDKRRRAKFMAMPPAPVYPRVAGVSEEFLQAVRGGPSPGATFDYAGQLTEVVLLGNVALRTGRPLDIDPVTGSILSGDVPNALIRPPYRKGWSL